MRPILAIPLVLLAGCAGEATRPVGTTQAPTGKAATQAGPIAANVVTVTVVGGTTLVEITAKDGVAIETGTLFRLASPATPNGMKAVLQITEVPAKGRAVGRVIALSDRNAPVIPGDVAAEVTDPAALATGPTEAALAAGAARDSSAKGADAQAEALRLELNRQLATVQAQHAAALAEVQAAATAAQQATDRDHAAALVRQRSAFDGQVAELRAGLADQIAQAVAAATVDDRQRIATLTAENARLGTRIAALAAGTATAERRVAEALAAREAADRAAANRLRAEVAAREAMSAQVVELEARLTGKTSPAAARIAADPAGEPVLDKITRLASELAVAQAAQTAAAAELERRNTEITRLAGELASAQTRVGDLEQRMADAEAARSRTAALERDLAAMRAAAEDARSRQAAGDLARLEAERSLFELATSVLRLETQDPGVRRLQAVLQRRLAGRPEAEPTAPPASAPATAPAMEAPPVKEAAPAHVATPHEAAPASGHAPAHDAAPAHPHPHPAPAESTPAHAAPAEHHP
jgi:hypothetical protein